MMRAVCIILICGVQLGWAAVASAVDFERDVAPILESRCISCHSADSAKGDVRLDTAVDLGKTIVVGDVEGSLLIDQVSGSEPAMPKDAKPLTPDQVEILKAWVASGAKWPEGRLLVDRPVRDLDWWSLKPLAPATKILSAVTSEAKSNPVDAFIQAKANQKGLVLNAPASDEVLLRRLVFDLTGLPPTAQQFADYEASGHEAMVDALLASESFGEKWGQHWLDVARYAETHGYDKDKPRPNAWPYRDYVIASLNADKPYDRFVQEQIAGDALFPGTSDGVIGLGFLAAGPWDFIGHVEVGERKLDGRIAKHLDRDEMISAVYNVFASTTVQCAQCHHHKFDPVLSEDYYRLHAIFSAVDRADRPYSGLTPTQEIQREELSKRLATLRAERDAVERGIADSIKQRGGDIDQRIDQLVKMATAEQNPAFGWHSQISGSDSAVKWVQVNLGSPQKLSTIRLIPAFDRYAGIGAGFGFPIRYRVEVSQDNDFKENVRVVFDGTKDDLHNPGKRDAVLNIDGEEVGAIRVTATKLATRSNDYIFALGEIEAIAASNQQNVALGAAVSSSDSIEQGPRWGMKNVVDGIYYRELDDPELREELAVLREKRSAIEREFRTDEVTKRLTQIADDMKATEAELKSFPVGPLVYSAAVRFESAGQFIATQGKPRSIAHLPRGDVASPGELMEPGMPPIWPSAQDAFPVAEEKNEVSGGTVSGETVTIDEAAARASFAKAMTSTDNPLFWRSIANRVWQWTFGKPIVGTPNDFGRMGMEPTHPELLDYLASRLREDPRHSLKAIVRLLVTSDAYKRSSSYEENNALIDGDNHFHWRSDRRRLTAEEYRDAVLAISGKLNLDNRSGPSFKDFVIEKPQHSPHYQYHLHDPNDPQSHRRSVYRFVVRSQPHPFLTALDCADPSQSVAARDESTTALQALTQWNHRLVEAMSKAFADRIVQQPDPIGFACQTSLGRLPSESERQILEQHLREHGAPSLARVIFNMNAFVYLD